MAVKHILVDTILLIKNGLIKNIIINNHSYWFIYQTMEDAISDDVKTNMKSFITYFDYLKLHTLICLSPLKASTYGNNNSVNQFPPRLLAVWGISNYMAICNHFLCKKSCKIKVKEKYQRS